MPAGRKHPSEHEEQVLLFRMAHWHAGRWPELKLMYAIPNGGARHPAVAGKLKAEGVKPGVPDICLPVPRGGYHGLYIELKTKTGRPTAKQIEWSQALAAQGYACATCRGAEAAWQQIEEYLTAEDSHAAS